MLKQTMIHLPWEPKPKEVVFGVVNNNWQSAVKVIPAGSKNPIVIYGEGKEIARQLRALADEIEGRTVDQWAEPEPDDLPPVPARQPSNEITMDLLSGDPFHDYPLIAQRFPWLAETLPAQYLKAQPVKDDQLTQDVARLLPIADTLRRGGKWNQSAIAQGLGLTNTGGSYRRRILDVIGELERRAA